MYMKFKQIKWHILTDLPKKKYNGKFIVAIDKHGIPYILSQFKSCDWLDITNCFEFPRSSLYCWAFLSIPEENEKKDENKSPEEKKEEKQKK